ncbi:hypothetical protein KUCAC02_003508 [Chaenocephalus aceratus]|uniref:Uncharacterized protein n=1 Tax=Chaenocephalus aceratus TaxID=36190 RepID=A0ACB9WMK5_CHAAC|nr:hypothetical protein KUCAC02_003508 [Chaenocephalus aceratus]
MNSCKNILGQKKRRHQDWYDENDTEIQQIIDIKRHTFITWQNNIHCKVKRAALAKAKAAVQTQVRKLKNQWWTKKALEIQQFADFGDTRGFFDATRAVYGPSYRRLTPLRSIDGLLLLKDKDAIANRWKEHYKDLLNRDTIPEMEALDQLPQQPIVEGMGEPPSLGEVQDAIKNMKNNKAAGPDGIPAEVLKKGGPDLLKHIHALLLKIWEEEEIPAQLRDALIVSIFKKGDRADCGNYRGISLLSTIGKALARVLANRLTPLSESILPESCSRRPSQSESLSSGSLWSSGRYLLSSGGQGPELEGVKSLKSSSLVLLVERPRPEVGVGESLKSSSLHASSQVLLVEKPRPDVDGGAEDGVSSGRSTCGAESSGGATAKGQNVCQKVTGGCCWTERGTMGQQRPKVEGAESLESSSLNLLVEKPRLDVEGAESMESSSLILFVEKTKPGVVGANTPDLGGAEGGPSSGRSSRGAESSGGATPKGRNACQKLTGGRCATRRGTMGQQRPKVEGAEFLESSSLILFLEKTKPGVLGANTPDLGGAEGGPSSGRSSRGAETSRGATPKGREQGFAGRKLGVKVPRNTSQTFNGGNFWTGRLPSSPAGGSMMKFSEPVWGGGGGNSECKDFTGGPHSGGSLNSMMDKWRLRKTCELPKDVLHILPTKPADEEHQFVQMIVGLMDTDLKKENLFV